jgi:hypothetical protein
MTNVIYAFKEPKIAKAIENIKDAIYLECDGMAAATVFGILELIKIDILKEQGGYD